MCTQIHIHSPTQHSQALGVHNWSNHMRGNRHRTNEGRLVPADAWFPLSIISVFLDKLPLKLDSVCQWRRSVTGQLTGKKCQELLEISAAHLRAFFQISVTQLPNDSCSHTCLLWNSDVRLSVLQLGQISLQTISTANYSAEVWILNRITLLRFSFANSTVPGALSLFVAVCLTCLVDPQTLHFCISIKLVFKSSKYSVSPEH